MRGGKVAVICNLVWGKEPRPLSTGKWNILHLLRAEHGPLLKPSSLGPGLFDRILGPEKKFYNILPLPGAQTGLRNYGVDEILTICT
jgi:hypothetical protein